jgi:hypothetical protein
MPAPPGPSESPKPPGPPPSPDAGEGTAKLLRPVVGVLANVTILTALLVYFGWRRSATQAERLGIYENILGMSTRDYVLRSVRPVLVLLVGIGVAGLAWVVLDRWLVPLVRSGLQRAQPGGAPDRRTVRLLRGLSLAWLVLPAVVWLMGFVWRPLAFVLFPVSIGAGLLLMLYAAHLRQLDAPSDDATRRRNAARQVSGALLVGVCLFWTAANYAQVQGVQLARQTAQQIDRLPGVVVYSRSPLHLDGPGVAETDLSGPSGNLRYRYRGLRLFEHTGGKYFLVSDGWTPAYGVLFVLADDDTSVRVDFVRDRR